MRTGYMEECRKLLRTQYKGDLIDFAVNCDLTFFMPIPKATSKKKRVLMQSGKVRPTTTPDRINLGKLLEDILQGVVLKNDSVIVGGTVEKWYSEEPRSLIKITPALKNL